MNDLTCIIIGGGYAGLTGLRAIKENTQGMSNGRRIRFVLFDKQPGHLRKLRLFRPAAVEEEIMIPWGNLVLKGFEFVQGTVTSVDSKEKRILRLSKKQPMDASNLERLCVAAPRVRSRRVVRQCHSCTIHVTHVVQFRNR